MFGLYLHVPFCARRCSYCNFYLTTDSSDETRYARALERAVQRVLPELRQADATDGYTVALGGGTPSRLDSATLHALLAALRVALGPALSECEDAIAAWRRVRS